MLDADASRLQIRGVVTGVYNPTDTSIRFGFLLDVHANCGEMYAALPDDAWAEIPGFDGASSRSRALLPDFGGKASSEYGAAGSKRELVGSGP